MKPLKPHEERIPHEETWELDSAPPDHPEHVRIIVQGSRAAFTPARARLAVAAPEMARALLAVQDRMERTGPEDVVDPLYIAICDALTKAGQS